MSAFRSAFYVFLLAVLGSLVGLALCRPEPAYPNVGDQVRSVGNELVNMFASAAQEIENEAVRCDPTVCDTACKMKPGYRGGFCNHYDLCSCYM